MNNEEIKPISRTEVEKVFDEIEPERNKSPRFGTSELTRNWMNESKESGR